MSEEKWFLGSEAVGRILKARSVFTENILQKVREIGFETTQYSPFFEMLLAGTLTSHEVRDLLPERVGSIPVSPGMLMRSSGIEKIQSMILNPSMVPDDLDSRVGTTIEEIGMISGMKETEFREGVHRALEVLQQHEPWIGELFAGLVVQIVPWHSRDGMDRRLGGSFEPAKGLVFLSVPKKPSSIRVYELAIDIAHEVAHQVIHTFLAFDPLMKSGGEKHVYSGVRGQGRPAIRSFHSCTALAYIVTVERAFCQFARDISSDKLQNIERFAEVNALALQKNIDELNNQCEFTSLGGQIMKECSDALG